MAREQWAIYVQQLPSELRELAQKLMNRIEQLLNKDRADLLDTIQRIEARMRGQSERIALLDDRIRTLFGIAETLEQQYARLAQQTGEGEDVPQHNGRGDDHE